MPDERGPLARLLRRIREESAFGQLLNTVDDEEERRALAAGIGHGLSSSGYATATGVARLADLIVPGEGPATQLTGSLRRSREEADEFYRSQVSEGTQGQFVTGSIAGRLVGDMGQIALTGAAGRAAFGVGGTLPSTARIAGTTPARLAGTRAAAGLGVSLPIAVSQAVGGREESSAGFLADLTGNPTLDWISRNTAARVAFEAATDMVLGGVFEAIPLGFSKLTTGSFSGRAAADIQRARRSIPELASADAAERGVMLQTAEANDALLGGTALRRELDTAIVGTFDPNKKIKVYTDDDALARDVASAPTRDTPLPEKVGGETAPRGTGEWEPYQVAAPREGELPPAEAVLGQPKRIVNAFGDPAEGERVVREVIESPYADPTDPLDDFWIDLGPDPRLQGLDEFSQGVVTELGDVSTSAERIVRLGGVPNRRLRGSTQSVRGQQLVMEWDAPREGGIGYRVHPERFAEFAEPFRNPKAEQLSLVSLDEHGNIRGWLMHTAGAIDYADKNFRKGLLNDPTSPRYIPNWVQRTGGDRVAIIHNHPSGKIDPTDGDKAVTAEIHAAMVNEGFDPDQAMAGHLIIDKDKVTILDTRFGEDLGNGQFRVDVRPEVHDVSHVTADDWTDFHTPRITQVVGLEDTKGATTQIGAASAAARNVAAALSAKQRLIAMAEGVARSGDRFDTTYLTTRHQIVAMEPHRPSASNYWDRAVADGEARGFPAGTTGNTELAFRDNWVDQRLKAHGAKHAIHSTSDPETYENLVRQARAELEARGWDPADKYIEPQHAKVMDVVQFNPDGTVARSAAKEGVLPTIKIPGEDPLDVALGAVGQPVITSPRSRFPTPENVPGRPAGSGTALQDARSNLGLRDQPTDVRGIPKTKTNTQLDQMGMSGIGLRKLEALKAEYEAAGGARTISWADQERAAAEIGLTDIQQSMVRGSPVTDIPTLRAMRDQINANSVELGNLYNKQSDLMQRMSRGEQVADELSQVQRVIKVLEGDNGAMFRTFLTGASEAGRTLQMFRSVSRNIPVRLDSASQWIAKAESLIGRDLMPDERILILDALGAGDQDALFASMSRMVNPPMRLLPTLEVENGFRRLFGMDPKVYTSSWAPVQGIITVRKAGFLTGLRTQARNFLSNTAEWMMRQADLGPTTLVDKVLSKYTGQRTQLLRPGRQVEAIRRGIQRTPEAFVNSLKGRPGLSSRGIARKLDMTREMHFQNRFADAYTKFIFRWQGAADQPHRQIAFMESLYRQADLIADGEVRAGRVSKADQEQWTQDFVQGKEALADQGHLHDSVVMEAIVDAENAVFQNPTQIGRWLSRERGALGKFIDFVIPFRQTPAAVFMRIVDRTPVGYVKSGNGIWRLLTDSGGMTKTEARALQRASTQQFGQATTGTLAIMAGMYLAHRGKASGRWPEDDAEARLWIQEGRSEDSVLLPIRPGGPARWRKLTGISPLGNLVAIGAQIYIDGEKAQNDTAGNMTIDGYIDVASRVGLGTAAALKEQSFLRGVDDFLTAIDPRSFDKDRALASQLGGSWVPMALQDAARFNDPVIRERTGISDAFNAGLPVRSLSVPAKLDEFGNPKILRPTLGERVVRLVDPFTSQTPRGEHDPMLGEMNRVGFALPRLGKRKGESEEDHRARQEAVGGHAREAFSQLIRSNEYRSLSREQKAETMRQLNTRVRSLFSNQKLPENWAAEITRAIRKATEVEEEAEGAPTSIFGGGAAPSGQPSIFQ